MNASDRQKIVAIMKENSLHAYLRIQKFVLLLWNSPVAIKPPLSLVKLK